MMITLEQLRPDIADLKTFLDEWLDQRLEKERLGPACIAMLETALERTTAMMGRNYANNLAADAVARLNTVKPPGKH